MPVLVAGVLFVLTMDYQAFLVSRMHGAHKNGLDTRTAVLQGFGQASPVVIATATATTTASAAPP
ncbi:MMPL family transporter [Streptomyces phaeochromogenes]|uniref:MMPL family transporter n=1 Tax=Streptomyces phaeochromogenes TaxID=1923 RepID=UPI0036778F8C